mgnify:CR=1 FL=1
MDNYDLWKEHDARQEEALARLPKCYECNEPIQDEMCYKIDGKSICESCLKENHMCYTDDCL